MGAGDGYIPARSRDELKAREISMFSFGIGTGTLLACLVNFLSNPVNQMSSRPASDKDLYIYVLMGTTSVFSFAYGIYKMLQYQESRRQEIEEPSKWLDE